MLKLKTASNNAQYIYVLVTEIAAILPLVDNDNRSKIILKSGERIEVVHQTKDIAAWMTDEVPAVSNPECV